MKGSRPLTEEEISLALDSFEGRFAMRDKALFTLLLKTGFRVSEGISLRVSDVLQSGKFVDRVRVERRNMKGKHSGRTVLLHPEAKAALANWIHELQPDSADAFLFKSQKGENQPLSRHQVWRAFNRVFKRLGLTGQLGTHGCRKSFAQKMFRLLDRDLVSVQRALGHRSISSTLSYLSFEEDSIDRAILAL